MRRETVAGPGERVAPGGRDAAGAVAARSPLILLAWVQAAVATGGSLYFSEVMKLVPCVLCWYQRIAMYPLVVILAVAVWRRDVNVRWYAIPIALIGAGVSTYHYFLEWFPQIDIHACKVGVPCTADRAMSHACRHGEIGSDLAGQAYVRRGFQ